MTRQAPFGWPFSAALLPAAGALGLLLLSCQPRASSLSPDDVAAIRTSTDRYVQTALAAEWDAWAALTTDDAVFLQPNGAAVEGRHAIRKWATAFTGLTRFSANVLAVEGRDDIAISRGTYSFVLGPEDGLPVADTGKFLTVWRRQPGGTWLISRNMWNSDRPALVLRVASSH